MTDLLLAWALLPLIAVALAVGTGMLVERFSRQRLPPELLVVVGLAGFVALCDLATLAGEASRFTTWLVVAIACAGLVDGVIARRRRGHPVDAGARLRPDGAVCVATSFGLALLASPFIASGGATFGAYGTLGDSAFQMLGLSFLPEIGRTTDGLDPSTVTSTLDGYFAGGGYPAGGPAALGVVSRIVGGDPFVTYAPGVVGLCGAMGLAVGVLLRPVTDRVTRGLAVLAAMQAPLLVAFTWQGSIKEIGIAAFVVALLAAGDWWIRALGAGGGPRTVIVPAIVVAGLLSMASLGAVPWLGTLLLLILVVLISEVHARRIGIRDATLAAGAALLCAALLAIPTFSTLPQLTRVAQGVLTTQTEVGNLGEPLPWWQTFAPWFNEDFRIEPKDAALTASQVLGGLVAVLGIAGVIVAARRRAWLVVAWAVASLVACIYVVRAGSPWADAKALAITAPVVLAFACLGTSLVPRGRAYVVGRSLLLGAVLLPVLVSTAYSYRGAALAPTARLDELRDMSPLIGRGPVLVPEFDEFAKVALRDNTPEVVNDAHRGRRVRALAGTDTGGFGNSVSVSVLRPEDVDTFPFVVLRGGPEVSWPAGFRLVRRTKHYVLLKRDPAQQRLVRETSPVDGTATSLASRAIPCPTPGLRRRLSVLLRRGDAAERAARRRLVRRVMGEQPDSAVRTGLVRPSASQADVPTWKITSRWTSDGGTIRTSGPGDAQGYLSVPATGRYRVWLEGDMNRPLSVAIDGRLAGTIDRAINTTRQSEPVGTVELKRGISEVRIARGGRSMRPGAANAASRPGAIGRLFIERADEPVVRSLGCGSPAALDWIAPGDTDAAVRALTARDVAKRAAARRRSREAASQVAGG